MLTPRGPQRDRNPPGVPSALWPMDGLGRVRNAGGAGHLDEASRDAAAQTLQILQTHIGAELHSVYVVGPRACGRDGPLEILALRRMGGAANDRAPTQGDVEPLWLAAAADHLEQRHPHAEPPQLGLRFWRDVFPRGRAFSPDRFRLGVASACVHGRDVARHIAPQRLSPAVANSWIVTAGPRIKRAAGRLALAAQPQDVRREARAIARTLLATAFALVMAREDVYTEDPALQRDLFALSHPAQAREAARACAYIARPPDAAYELLLMLDGFGRWLMAQCDLWLDVHNPQRRAALPL